MLCRIAICVSLTHCVVQDCSAMETNVALVLEQVVVFLTECGIFKGRCCSKFCSAVSPALEETTESLSMCCVLESI